MKKFTLLLVLFLASVCQAVSEPLWEYHSDFNGVQCSRNSIACQLPSHRGNAATGDASQVSANTIRTETTVVTSMAQSTRVAPNDKSWFVFGVSDGNIIATVSPKVYSLPADVTSSTWESLKTEIFDTTDANYPFVDYSTQISCLKILDNGWWLLSTGGGDAGGGTPADGYLFLSKDKGLSWAKVLTMTKGTAKGFSFLSGVNGSMIALGSYSAYKYVADGPRNVYFSEDYGQTWDLIYDPGVLTDPADYTSPQGRHVHVCSIKDINTVYVSYGDIRNDRIIKLVRPADWEEGNWDATIISYNRQPTVMLYDNGYIILGQDGAGYAGDFCRIDTSNDTFVNDHYTPLHQTSGAYFRQLSNKKDTFSIVKHNGVFYAGSFQEADDPTGVRRNGGIYISTDGIHWTCYWRQQGSGWNYAGVNYIKFVHNDWVWFQSWDNYNTIFKIPVASARVLSAIRIEKGVTNLCNKTANGNGNDSYFVSSKGSWVGVNCTASFDDTESLIGSEGSVKAVPTSASGVSLQSGMLKTDYGMTGSVAEVDDYLVGSFWVKAGPNYPSGIYLTIRDSRELEISAESSRIIPNQNWQKVTYWGRITNDNLSTTRFFIGLYSLTGFTFEPPYSNATFWIDGVQFAIVKNSGGVAQQPRHLSSSTFQYGGTSRVNEVVSFPVAGVGDSFTVSFSWFPDCSSREWGPSTAKADVQIAHLVDPDGKYIEISYDSTQGKFTATDGTNTATTAAASWEWLDQINFVLKTGRTAPKFTLVVQTPKDGQLADADSAGINFNAPLALTIGANKAGTDFGCGLFCNIRAWDSELSSSDIVTVLNSTGALWEKIPADLDIDGDVDFVDYAVLAKHWMEQNCVEPNRCSGADLDKSGSVDLYDLDEFADNWLLGL